MLSDSSITKYISGSDKGGFPVGPGGGGGVGEGEGVGGDLAGFG